MSLTPGCRGWPAGLLGLAGLLTAGCAGEKGLIIDPPDWPGVDAASVAPVGHNVLSAVVTAAVSFSDSVAVRYGIQGGPLDSLTPATLVQNDDVTLPVLGVLPGTTYRMQVLAYGQDSTAVGPLLTFTTGALPADIPSYTASGTSPSAGFVLFAVGNYGIVIDNTGRIVWYRRLAGPTLNIQAQPTGRYTTLPTVTDSTNPTPVVEYDNLGNPIRSFGCALGLRPRFHDLLVEPDGSSWLMCDETRNMDLTSIGGQSTAQVTGTMIQHVSTDGTLLFSWSPFNHFSLIDLDSLSRSGPTVNWTHGNALDFDENGNLLVSFRSLSEITKIDVVTGAVIWRMGGLANQFTFPPGFTPFARQHGLRVIGPGQFQVLDNLGELTGTRAERYQFDELNLTATLVTSYSALPAVTAQLGGTTQLLSGGRILVAYGNGGRVQEYDAGGNVVWEIQGSPGYIFRAQRILSLYHPGAGTAR